MNAPKYWIAVVSKEHAMKGVGGGFMQVCHGKQAPLKRIRQDDWIIVYSPRLSMTSEVKCQTFTAIGQASDDCVFQFRMSDDFIPFRRQVGFLPCHETSILPMINDLEFIRNKKSWGYPFRTGFFEIKQRDFDRIRSKMLDHEIIGQHI